MGAKSADVQREIEHLRRETSMIVTELEHRAARATNVRAQVAEHPFIVGGALLTTLGTIGLLAYAISQRRIEVPEMARRRQPPVSQMRERLGALVPEAIERRPPGMLKQVMWAMLSAGMVATAGLLARRLSASLWSATLREPPPRRVL